MIGLAGGLVVSALLVVPVIAGSVRQRIFGGDGMDFAFPGLILPLLILAGLIWLLTWVMPRFNRGDPALALIRDRYARGEIDDAEYARLRDGLRRDLR